MLQLAMFGCEGNVPEPQPPPALTRILHVPLITWQGRHFASIPDNYLPVGTKEVQFGPKLYVKFSKRKPISMEKGFLN